MRLSGHVARMKKLNSYTILVGRPELKSAVDMHKLKWGDII
jgi:hypothetical protein